MDYNTGCYVLRIYLPTIYTWYISVKLRLEGGIS